MSIYLSLGSNLENRLNHLHSALSYFSVLAQSSIYETEPVDYLSQPWFLNVVVEIGTELSPQQLLRFCLEIETKLGRKRDIPKGPRTIDIDLLFYNDLILNNEELILPHPRIAERRFVLIPLNEIAPALVHPVLKKSMAELLFDCIDNSIVRKMDSPRRGLKPTPRNAD
jgi:2-amino-4-hydroxy-6-hydroxymethyldihydropteridine diphosphokinase